jgi:hypothetical protein
MPVDEMQRRGNGAAMRGACGARSVAVGPGAFIVPLPVLTSYVWQWTEKPARRGVG